MPKLVVLLTKGIHAWSLVVRVHDTHWNGMVMHQGISCLTFIGV